MTTTKLALSLFYVLLYTFYLDKSTVMEGISVVSFIGILFSVLLLDHHPDEEMFLAARSMSSASFFIAVVVPFVITRELMRFTAYAVCMLFFTVALQYDAFGWINGMAARVHGWAARPSHAAPPTAPSGAAEPTGEEEPDGDGDGQDQFPPV